MIGVAVLVLILDLVFVVGSAPGRAGPICDKRSAEQWEPVPSANAKHLSAVLAACRASLTLPALHAYAP